MPVYFGLGSRLVMSAMSVPLESITLWPPEAVEQKRLKQEKSEKARNAKEQKASDKAAKLEEARLKKDAKAAAADRKKQEREEKKGRIAARGSSLPQIGELVADVKYLQVLVIKNRAASGDLGMVAHLSATLRRLSIEECPGITGEVQLAH